MSAGPARRGWFDLPWDQQRAVLAMLWLVPVLHVAVRVVDYHRIRGVLYRRAQLRRTRLTAPRAAVMPYQLATARITRYSWLPGNCLSRSLALFWLLRHVRGRSTDIVLPEPATVIVSDQLGPLGFDCGLTTFYCDAVQRLAAPGCRLLPSVVTTHLAPCEHALHAARVDAWSIPRHGLSFEPFRRHAANTVHLARLDFGTRLAVGTAIWTMDLASNHDRLDGDGTWRITRRGRLNGLIGWFTATLCDGVVLTNAPDAADRITRACAYLPFDPPVDVQEGDRLEAHLHARPDSGLITWRATLTRADTPLARWKHSTLRGSFLSETDVMPDP